MSLELMLGKTGWIIKEFSDLICEMLKCEAGKKQPHSGDGWSDWRRLVEEKGHPEFAATRVRFYSFKTWFWRVQLKDCNSRIKRLASLASSSCHCSRKTHKLLWDMSSINSLSHPSHMDNCGRIKAVFVSPSISRTRQSRRRKRGGKVTTGNALRHRHITLMDWQQGWQSTTRAVPVSAPFISLSSVLEETPHLEPVVSGSKSKITCSYISIWRNKTKNANSSTSACCGSGWSPLWTPQSKNRLIIHSLLTVGVNVSVNCPCCYPDSVLWV